MINITEDLCTGCRACEAICPVKAIKMNSNSEGFIYPQINNQLCINCNLCNNVCPIEKKVDKKENLYYIVQHRDVEQRLRSQSGGLFAAIAETILKNSGICYGAAIDEEFKVNHKRIDSLDKLWTLQGSKYVQSNTLKTFQEVKQDLLNDKIVLYSGTSCMISGLKRFLSISGTNIENLITCDFICHGVASPKVWNENIKYQEQKHGVLKKVNFRDKKNGWHSHMESYLFEDLNIVSENYYTELFYSHAILRKCCYSCMYLDIDKKSSDITMADFWGIKTAKLDIKDDNTGISVAVVHSEKGLKLLNASNLLIVDTDKSTATSNNLSKAATMPKWRANFWYDLKNNGYEYCLKKYTIYGGVIFKIKRKVLTLLNRW